MGQPNVIHLPICLTWFNKIIRNDKVGVMRRMAGIFFFFFFFFFIEHLYPGLPTRLGAVTNEGSCTEYSSNIQK